MDWPSEHAPNHRDGVFEIQGGELDRYRRPYVNAGLGIGKMLAEAVEPGQPTREDAMTAHVDALPMKVDPMSLSGLMEHNPGASRPTACHTEPFGTHLCQPQPPEPRHLPGCRACTSPFFRTSFLDFPRPPRHSHGHYVGLWESRSYG